MRRLLPALAAVLLAAACGSGGASDQDAGAASLPSGDDAGLLDFTAEDVYGEAVDVSTYADADLVVWFWAPW